MYSVSAFGRMITDTVRVDAYTEAMRQSIFPGAIVLEIGSGTGFFAMLACRMGAGHVHAIEPNETITLAQQVAVANGLSDRITFHEKMSTEVALSEKADVVISDLRGVLPLFAQHIPSIADARERLLKPGGVQIPQRDRLFAALISSEEHYKETLGPWDPSFHGLDWSSTRRMVFNEWRKAKVLPSELLSPPVHWVTLDYTRTVNPNVNGRLILTSDRAETAHGFTVWFDTELIEGVGFSNAPDKPIAIYGRAYFPFESPIELDAGQKVQVDMRADLAGSEYVWSWKTSVGGRALFSQSTFKSVVLSPSSFRKSAISHRPALNRDGMVTRWLLEAMDGQRTNEELASALQSKFPEQFSSLRAAIDRVTGIAQKYS